jgi:hypothetical protein
MLPLRRFINCGLTDHFDGPALFSLFIHCFIGVVTSAVKVLGCGTHGAVARVAVHPIAPSAKMAIRV